jgi:hypothetical protein
MKATTTAILLTSTTTAISGFAILPQNSNYQLQSTTKLNGLFDGVKEAFSAPPTQLDSERETPIDRWMGWSVVSENAPTDSAAPAGKDVEFHRFSVFDWMKFSHVLPSVCSPFVLFY